MRAIEPIRECLEGVLVAKTMLSHVDGERGQLIISGSNVENLAGTVSFETMCERLWSSTPITSSEFVHALGSARMKAFHRFKNQWPWVKPMSCMDALRSLVASLDESFANNITLTAAISVAVAGWIQLHLGREVIAPNAEMPHAQDLLRMIYHHEPTNAEIHAFETYLVTVMDHGMNASTFAARVVASTGSDRVSAVVAAIGALKGPLHGGAPGPVLDMLSAIGRPENAAEYIENELREGKRIMGMGHRIYKVRDPRAFVLERAVMELEKSGCTTEKLSLARAVERAAEGALRSKYPNRSLCANVEFYTAVLLDTLRIPVSAFSGIFAMGRVVGWCAHITEQIETGRLIRPDSIYVGPMPTTS